MPSIHRATGRESVVTGAEQQVSDLVGDHASQQLALVDTGHVAIACTRSANTVASVPVLRPLLGSGGFDLTRLIPTQRDLTIMEATPRP